MKIYTRIEMDICTGRILSSDSFEYSGPMAWCGSGEETANIGQAEGAPAKSESTDPLQAVQGSADTVMGQMTGNQAGTRLPVGFQGDGAAIANQINSQLVQPVQQIEGYEPTSLGRPAIDASGSGYRDMTPDEQAAYKQWSVMQDKNDPLSAVDRALPFLPLGLLGAAGGAAASGMEAGSALAGESAFGPATGTVLPAGEAASGATSFAAPGAGSPTVIGTATGGGGFLDSMGNPLPSPGGGGGGGTSQQAGTPAGTTSGTPVGSAADIPAATAPSAPTGPTTATPVSEAAPVTSSPAPANTTTPSATGISADSGSFSAPGEAYGGAPPKPAPPTAGPDQGIVSKAMKALGLYDPKTGGIGTNALPLALSAGGQVMAQRSKNSLQNQLTAAAKPAAGAANQLLDRGLNGQVPPAVMQQFDLSYKQKVGEITQRFANMGRDPKTDSAAQAEMQKAKDAMDAQVANYASTLTTQGLQAAGLAQGPTTQAALAGAQQDQALQQSMASAMQQMAMLTAMQGNKQGAPAP